MARSKNIVLQVERDSVCAGDDMDAPHTRRFSVMPDATLAEVLAKITKDLLPRRIVGGKATWIVEGDLPLAVIAQQWMTPGFLVQSTTPISECVKSRRLFFRYWCQVEPATVMDCLKEGRPLPDKYGRA